MNWDAFFTLHQGLPREGPGCRADLDWACKLAKVPDDARILDAGCGPGADIEGLLAQAPRGRVVAVDTHAPFVDVAKSRFEQDDRVTCLACDMRDAKGPFDFIWSAGALYFLGIKDGLQAMTAKLKPEGALAFSHLVYTVDTPDPALTSVLEAEPGIMGANALQSLIQEDGFELLGQRLVPDSAWEAYYAPMRDRIAALRPGADAELHAVLDDGAAEIKLRDDFGHQYGYVLSVVRPQ